jgi:hypothetical protein
VKCLGVDFGIEHKNGATGFRASGKSHQIEIWKLPCGTIVQPHIHKCVHSFIIALWGKQRWTVKETVRVVIGPFRKRESNGKLTFAAQSIPAGVRHATTALTFSMFLNLERTTRGISAATDFIEVP